MKLWAKVGKKTLWNHCKHENSSSPFLLDCSSLGIKEGKESLTTAATYTIRTGLWMLNTCMYVCLSRMWMYTNVGRVRPVLEGSLLFLFIILFLLTLCRQELLSSAGLGEGGGHELADVSPLCLDKLLCRWQRKKNKKKTNRGQLERSADLTADYMMGNSSWAYGYHCAALRPGKGPCKAVRDSGSSSPRLHGDVCTPANHKHPFLVTPGSKNTVNKTSEGLLHWSHLQKTCQPSSSNSLP